MATMAQEAEAFRNATDAQYRDLINGRITVEDLVRANLRMQVPGPVTVTGSTALTTPALPDEPTQWSCPENEYGDSHHLLPRAAGLTCRDCKATEKVLREQQHSAVKWA